jgi:hypothetical protein
MRACHRRERLHSSFDDPRLVADAGLPPPGDPPAGPIAPSWPPCPTPPCKRRGGVALRLVVSRVPACPDAQLRLFPSWGYHAFISDRPGDPVALTADHRRHAAVEATIRDLKYGVGRKHFPSGHFGANAAWLALNVLAHNLARWVGQLGPRRSKRCARCSGARSPAPAFMH